jgi:polar amino acid transport system permease protein
MDLDFSPVWDGWQELAHGTLLTVEITAGAIALGCLVGLAVGLGRLDPRRRLLYAACTAYVSVIRGTPLLVQLFIWFFGLPHFGINLPAFFCGVVGMGMYSGAYVSEIVRGAIQSIDRGQMEAARSLGMSHLQAMRHIIVPQAVTKIPAPMLNEMISLLKDTTLVSVIAFAESVLVSREILAEQLNSSALTLTAAFFLVICLPGARLVDYLIKRNQGKITRGAHIEVA